MHIRSYHKLQPEAVPDDILTQITEAQVVLWLAARLQRLRADGIPTEQIALEVWFRDWTHDVHLDACWNLHTRSCLAITHPTVASAVLEIRREMADRPAERAAEMKRKARELLAEAAELDAAAPH